MSGHLENSVDVAECLESSPFLGVQDRGALQSRCLLDGAQGQECVPLGTEKFRELLGDVRLRVGEIRRLGSVLPEMIELFALPGAALDKLPRT